MNNFLKYCGLVALVIFSFYYTAKISKILIYHSDLMNKIMDSKLFYENDSIDAVIIDNNYIIPGINAIKVNELESYYQMQNEKVFKKEKLVYKEINPNISIENNKKYTINKGNAKKNAVSLIVSNNHKIIDYSIKNNINITRLIEYTEFSKEYLFEQINKTDNQRLDMLLNKYKLNKNICFNIKCQNDDKYKVTYTYEINNYSLINQIISSGDIIMIDDNLNLNKFIFLCSEIKYRNLKVLPLSKLINEKIDY